MDFPGLIAYNNSSWVIGRQEALGTFLLEWMKPLRCPTKFAIAALTCVGKVEALAA